MNTTQDDEKPAQTPPQEEYMAMMREANSPETKDRNLRDWFAGMALQGALACPASSGKFTDFANDSYCYADAMLAARKEQP
jgi:hypothetical protein